MGGGVVGGKEAWSTFDVMYCLLRVKWTISGKEVRSTFEVQFIKGEVDRQ